MIRLFVSALWKSAAGKAAAVASFGLLMVLIGYVLFAREQAAPAVFWLIGLLLAFWALYVLGFGLQRMVSAYQSLAARLDEVQQNVGALRQEYPALTNRLDEMQRQVEQLLRREEVEKVPVTPTELAATARRSDDEIAYQTAAERYGMAYDSLDVDCILSDDGSALVYRHIKVTATSQFAELDTFLYAPEPTDAGEPWELDPGFVEVRSLTPGRQIEATAFKRESGRLSALLRIEPPLLSGESMIYEMQQRLPAAFYTIYLSPTEFDPEEDNFDYWGWTINRPTRRLHLRVYLPQGNVKPQDYNLQVRYASASDFPSQRAQYEERARANKVELQGPDGGRYILDLSVEYPVTGLIYVLRWLPPFRTIPLAPIKPALPEKVSGAFPGIAPELLVRVRDQLILCGPFASEGALKAVFIDNRISPWRNDIPEGDSVKERVEMVMAFLFNQTHSAGQNGLVLFLRVLSERHKPGDACGDILAALAVELEQNLTSSH